METYILIMMKFKKTFILLALFLLSIVNNTANALEESLKESCNNNNYMKACSMLALFYLEEDGPLEQDLSKAATFFKKACAGNWASACHNIGYMNFDGIGMEKDFYESKRYFQQACNMDYPDSCAYLAIFYIEGYAVEKDDFKAVELVEKSCEGDSGHGCYILGGLYERGMGVRKNLCSSLHFYGKACDIKFSAGCSHYARVLDITKSDC